jgi:hypothetical protein
MFDNNTPVTLKIIPGHVGWNVFDVEIGDKNNKLNQDIQDVKLLIHSTDQNLELPQIDLIKTESQNEDLYSSVSLLPMPGHWNVRVGTFVDGKFLTKTFEFTTINNEHMDNMTHMAGMTDMIEHKYGYANDKTFESILRFGTILICGSATAVLVYEWRKK